LAAGAGDSPATEKEKDWGCDRWFFHQPGDPAVRYSSSTAVRVFNRLRGFLTFASNPQPFICYKFVQLFHQQCAWFLVRPRFKAWADQEPHHHSSIHSTKKDIQLLNVFSYQIEYNFIYCPL
jgi:hypothetical protein